MGTASSESAETLRIDPPARGSSSEIHDRVVDLANQSSDRTEFLQRMAADLRAEFRVAIIAVQASHWSSPMMLVADDAMKNQFDRDAIHGLLASSTPMPIACDIPNHDSSVTETARGIRIELTAAPERAAVLLVYPNQQSPAAGTQITDLRHLSMYADSVRIVAPQVPIGNDRDPFAEAAGLSHPAASEIQADRRSLRLFHLDLDLHATSYRIANESRRLLGCDRTTVLVHKSGRLRVNAVSGISVVDTRSNSVRAIERLAQAAVVMSQPLCLPCDEPLAPQIQDPLDEYLDESGVMSAIVLPLHAPDPQDEAEGIEASVIDPFAGDGEIIGVVVLEYFSGQSPDSVGPAITTVASEAMLSLRNSLEHRQVFGLSLWKSVGRLVHSQRMPLVVSALLLGIGLLLAMMFCKVDHYVIATGSIEPTTRREVFATIDGIVKKLHVEDGQLVKAGDVLLELENPELEKHAESLAGEIQTASKRLSSIQAVRLSQGVDPSQSSRLALEERQLQSELANLRAQQDILRTQQAELLVTSPIDGTVIGWQLRRRLADRPVSRGNLLVSVANHQGPWSLRLRVPDRHAGPVLASAKRNPRLPVQFAVATLPEASFSATLESVSTAARLDSQSEHVIDATAMVNVEDTALGEQRGIGQFSAGDVRVGADVTAKIACDERSVLRSWFSDVFDFAHRNILFYF